MSSEIHLSYFCD